LKPKENLSPDPASGSSQRGSVQANRGKLEVKAVNKQHCLKQQSDELKNYALEMQLFIDNLRMASQGAKFRMDGKK
jgi:hypothetical protein